MNKLNRVKKVLSAQGGAKVPSWMDAPEYKYTKSKGPLFIYSKDGSEWYQDIAGHPSIYYGPLEGFSDINPQSPIKQAFSLNGVKSETFIPGAASNNPNSAVEAAALANLKVQNEIATEQAVKSFQNNTDISTMNAPTINILGLNLNDLKEESKKMTLLNTELEKEREEKKLKQLKQLNIALGTTAIFQGVGTAFGALQAAIDSNTTKVTNQVYNIATDAVENMGPVGKVVGTALKNAAIAGDIIQGLGGGTDQMTSTDKWMDSSFFSWNVGMINGFGGKRADTFAADKDVLENVGSSYGGTSTQIMDAASKSGKKYGLFSSSARKRANRAMADARAKQNIMADISDEATDQRLAVLSMGELAGLAYSLMTDGGYNQKYTYAAKHGGTLEWNPEITLEWEPQIELNWELPAFKEGGQISEELEWVPEFQEGGPFKPANPTLEILEEHRKMYYPQEYVDFIDSVKLHDENLGLLEPKGYNMFRYWQLHNKPKTWELAISNGNKAMFIMYDDGKYHARSVAYNPELDEYEWMKNAKHNTAWMEKAWYDGYDFEKDDKGNPIISKDYDLYEGTNPKLIPLTGDNAKKSKDFRNTYELVEDENGWRKYVRRKTEIKKDGGTLKDALEIPEIEETTQKNVIPEGALHKNKHHMEHAEGLTKKGIPVIDEDGELQAEIELNEIIFTLEVTKKLEEYYEIFYSEDSTNKEKELAALEAGKLLVYEILENTDDRTGLIESCKLGGSLTLKKSTDDLIEEALEWIPNIIVIEETIEEKPKKEKSEKELMKEAIKEVLIELLTK